MYLIDTNVVSEIRKQHNANPGVIAFFQDVIDRDEEVFVSVITIGELRRGVDKVRHRGDSDQADRLEHWLNEILGRYSEQILDFSVNEAQIWGRLRVPHPENALDKQIAATALAYDLILVTRNIDDFAGCSVRLMNPFS
ncbi:MAG: type II toxin-antitoxin system VapC family toxin [Leptospiraceae bacterium]|nr:type II toxin-antitoxin system VapC family toxin [Leptospiraceae bacterium]